MERDDLINDHNYSVAAYHDEAHGKVTRKSIVKVTIILSVLTIVEVIMGAMIGRDDSWTWQMVKYAFIVMTLVKAAYIVLSFMHLGDERKSLKKMIIIPYVFFILYMIALIILSEANYVNEHVSPFFE
ncbi:MAG: cytochrome c oxidase subunit 4 [Ulvibacter sp.]|jgi:cytochrome c oxidase subunit 4